MTGHKIKSFKDYVRSAYILTYCSPELFEVTLGRQSTDRSILTNRELDQSEQERITPVSFGEVLATFVGVPRKFTEGQFADNSISAQIRRGFWDKDSNSSTGFKIINLIAKGIGLFFFPLSILLNLSKVVTEFLPSIATAFFKDTTMVSKEGFTEAKKKKEYLKAFGYGAAFVLSGFAYAIARTFLFIGKSITSPLNHARDNFLRGQAQSEGKKGILLGAFRAGLSLTVTLVFCIVLAPIVIPVLKAYVINAAIIHGPVFVQKAILTISKALSNAQFIDKLGHGCNNVVSFFNKGISFVKQKIFGGSSVSSAFVPDPAQITEMGVGTTVGILNAINSGAHGGMKAGENIVEKYNKSPNQDFIFKCIDGFGGLFENNVYRERLDKSSESTTPSLTQK